MDKDNSFEQVISQHRGILWKVANLYCQNEEDRKDVVQEMLIQLWRAFDKYDSNFKYSTWIYRIALNVAISFYRKNSAKENRTTTLETEEIAVSPAEISETENRLSLLEKFISELKELDKALMLLYLEEKSHKEIAEILGISTSNVATKINRIKENLKRRFAEEK